MYSSLNFAYPLTENVVLISVSIYIYYIQVKKKAFKINAIIEDVGLNED